MIQNSIELLSQLTELESKLAKAKKFLIIYELKSLDEQILMDLISKLSESSLQ